MPAKSRFVRDLQPNETITEFFLVQSKDIRLKKSGDPYLSLNLSDRTGRLDAKMWDGMEEVVETFDRADFVKVQGFTQIYRNRPQMTIQRLRRADESEIELADYLPHTEKDIDQMWTQLRATVDGIENPHLKRLLEGFVDDEDVAPRLKVAPAAKTLHHASIGGLLEHITSLLNLAHLVAGNYDFIDADLLKTGVILHDLGKIYELNYDRLFGYTNEGQLLGHITIMLRLLDRKCAEIGDFPPQWKTLVEHMILSHHGRYEFGSPKLPSFPEALLLHYLDDLDSKLENMRSTVASATLDDSDWTAYSPSLERALLNKEKFLGEGDESKAGEESPGPGLKKDPPSGPGEPSSGAPPPSGASGSLFGERLKSALDRRENK